MSRDELLEKLKELQKNGDAEVAHGEADDLLIAYINDDEIEKEFDAVPKWYA